ncbi:MAG: hypothetical protein ACE5FU_10635, partial [Nitrospinota bacterium]
MSPKKECAVYAAVAGILVLLFVSPKTFSEPAAYLDPVIFSSFKDAKGEKTTEEGPLPEKTFNTLSPNWEKTFPAKAIGFLRATWTGDKILFLSERTSGASGQKSQTFSLINTAGETIKTWEVGAPVVNLYFDGEAKSLLVNLKNGNSLYYPDLEQHSQYKVLVGAGKDSLIFPRSKNVLVVRDHPHVDPLPKDESLKAELFVLSPEGDSLWTYTEVSDPEKAVELGYRWMFGFLPKKKENYLLKVSNTGELFLNKKDKLLWKNKLAGTPISVAVPFFEGKRYAVSTSEKKGNLYFFNDQGRKLWNITFEGGARSMVWSTVGNILAAYGNTSEGQKVRVYTSLGSEIWKKDFPKNASRNSKIYVSALGKVISAGIQENTGRWVIHGWNNVGENLWSIVVKGELIDFFTAWNGRNI